jgi:hypothetical protein
LSKYKNKTGLDLAAADHARFDADTVDELRELVSKLAESKHAVEALEGNDLSGMVAFLETFDSPAAEAKFILHHVTKAVGEQKPESLLRWAMVYMLRHSAIAPKHSFHELLKVIPPKSH